MVLLPLDLLVHQAQLAQKGLAVFLACKEMMVFRVFRGLLDILAVEEQKVMEWPTGKVHFLSCAQRVLFWAQFELGDVLSLTMKFSSQQACKLPILSCLGLLLFKSRNCPLWSMEFPFHHFPSMHFFSQHIHLHSTAARFAPFHFPIYLISMCMNNLYLKIDPEIWINLYMGQ